MGKEGNEGAGLYALVPAWPPSQDIHGLVLDPGAQGLLGT